MPPIPTSQKRPFIPAQGIMQAEMVFTYLGQVCENVFHVIQGDGATAPTIPEMNALGDALLAYETQFGSVARSNQAALQNVIVRDLTTQSAPAVIRQPGAPIVGQVATQPMPGNVTVAVKWNTALRGRSFRGRTYHIGLVASGVAGDQLVPATLNDLLARYAQLRTSINGVAGCTMGVVSFAHNNFWRDAGLFTPITSATIDPNLDSQRRRLTGRGK